MLVPVGQASINTQRLHEVTCNDKSIIRLSMDIRSREGIPHLRLEYRATGSSELSNERATTPGVSLELSNPGASYARLVQPTQ